MALMDLSDRLAFAAVPIFLAVPVTALSATATLLAALLAVLRAGMGRLEIVGAAGSGGIEGGRGRAPVDLEVMMVRRWGP